MLSVPLLTDAQYGTLQVSADGNVVAVSGKVRVEGQQDRHLSVVFDARTGKLVGPPVPGSRTFVMAADGKVGVYEDFGQSPTVLRLHDIAAGTSKPVPVKRTGLFLMRLAPDGSFMVFHNRTRISTIRTADGTPFAPPIPLPGRVRSLSKVYAGGTRVACVFGDGRIAIVDLKANHVERVVDAKFAYAEQVEVAPDGGLLLGSGPRGYMYHGWGDTLAAFTIPKTGFSGPFNAHPLSGARWMVDVREYENRPGAGEREILNQWIAVAGANGGATVAEYELPLALLDNLGSMKTAASADGRRVVALLGDARKVCVWDAPAE